MARPRRDPLPAAELALAPVSRPSLAELAHDRISRSILAGEIVPGAQLKETLLSEQLGMSRAPIREALKRLADEHLAVERPRYGVFVREFTATDVIDIYNVRLAIETTAARLFIRAGAATEPLRALIAEMDAAAEAADLAGVVDAEVRFHETLCLLCDNAYVSGVFQSLKGPIHMAMRMDDRSDLAPQALADGHDPIVAALEGGDEQVAVAVLSEHITASIADVVRRLGGDPRRILA